MDCPSVKRSSSYTQVSDHRSYNVQPKFVQRRHSLTSINGKGSPIEVCKPLDILHQNLYSKIAQSRCHLLVEKRVILAIWLSSCFFLEKNFYVCQHRQLNFDLGFHETFQLIQITFVFSFSMGCLNELKADTKKFSCLSLQTNQFYS